jgi:hypothetical protein
MSHSKHSFDAAAQRVLFHFVLFGEFCDDEAEEMDEANNCECLRDAVEELTRHETRP